MQDEDGLYIVPLNFGYQYSGGNLTLYFHSAKEGRKVDAFHKNNTVAFEMDCGHKLIEGNLACDYSYTFKSVIGKGFISVIHDPEEMIKALSLLMKHQTGKDFMIDGNMANAALIYKLDAVVFTGKQKMGQ
jgi:nitroimidazol reductase NimA-like FMN-containing flavoprotein (pyridoxamine 5'-phosphate oxidase superfamily)